MIINIPPDAFDLIDPDISEAVYDIITLDESTGVVVRWWKGKVKLLEGVTKIPSAEEDEDEEDNP